MSSRSGTGRPLGARWIRALLLLFPREFRREYGEALLAAYLDLRDDIRSARSPIAAPWVTVAITLATGWQVAREGVAERWDQRRRARRSTDRGRKQTMVASLRSDLRYAVRTHRKHPAVAILALITLALGVGAGTAIFSVVNGVLLRPLPYADPEELVSVQVNSGIGSSEGFYDLSEPEFLDFGSRIASFAGIAGFSGAAVTLGDTLAPRRIRVLRATASLFAILGVEPLLGRAFSPEEDVPGGPRLLVLSYGMWQGEFGGDPQVLGRTLVVNDQPVTVIGVMPAGFAFPRPGWDAYSQLQLDREDPWARTNHYLPTIARLAPGATLQQARSELEVLAARSTEEHPDYYPNTGLRVQVRSLHDTLVGRVRTALYVLLAAVGFVLLTVCVNVANLLLARGEARKREIAVRAAMGASGGRITRQLLTESLLLAVLGGIVGLAVAGAGIRVLLAMTPGALPRMEEIGVDGTVMAFALLGTVATGLVFGVMPAFQAGRREVQETLREGGGERGATRSGLGLRRGLVVAQVGLAVVLVTGSGLMLRSVAELYAVDLGFATENILTFRITPRPAVYDTPEKTVVLYRELLARVNALPGVRAAAATGSLPMTGGGNNWSILIEGSPVANIGEAPADLVQRVTPEYLEALGLTLVQGRWFTPEDGATSLPVVVVTESMARKHWPGEDATGKRMKVFVPDWPWMEVIGVVKDVRHQGPGDDPRPRWFVPHAQAYVSAYNSPLSNTITVRADRDPTPLMGPIQDVIRELDSSIPISNVQTMEQVLDGAVGSQRFVVRLLTTFGLLALFLAAVGVYGVVSYTVSRRTREIGLRLALGARTGEVLNRVLREGIVLALVGVGVGLLGAYSLSRVFASLVFGVTPTDPVTYGGVAFVLLGSVALASVLPARRASRISPVEALREE